MGLFIRSCTFPLSASPLLVLGRTNDNRSDIEQEVNGLYSIHRQEKVPAENVRAIMDSAREYYYNKVVSGHSQAAGLGSKVREEVGHFISHARLGSNPGCSAHH